MTFSGCPYQQYRDLDNPQEPVKEGLYYLAESGKSAHLEFQNELRSLQVDWLRLFQAPDKSKLHPKALEKLTKYNRTYDNECIELPLCIEKYDIIAYIDAILEEKIGDNWSGIPIPMDFKFKHFLPKIFNDWVKNKRLPMEKDFTQGCVYMWELTENNILGAKPQEFIIAYLNKLGLDDPTAEQEYTIDFRPELRQLIQELLDEHLKQMVAYRDKQEITCTNKFCSNHGNEKFDLWKWVK